MIINISAPITQNVGQPQKLLQSGPSPTSGGSGGLADSPWPMFRQNLNHTGVSPYDTSGNNGQLKWRFPTGSYIDSTPVIGSDNTIYIGSADIKLYAINPNGSEKWHFKTDSSIVSSPAISSEGTIYIGSVNGVFYAINPDGSKKWDYKMGDQIWDSSPAIGTDGTIYIGCYIDNMLYAFNQNGSVKWSYYFGGGYGVRSSPAIDVFGTIYVGTSGGSLYAFNSDGSVKWRYNVPGRIHSSPAIDTNGTIYVGSNLNDPTFHAINPDGTKKWDLNIGSDVQSSPAIGSDGTIYFGSCDKKFYAINPDGTQKWSIRTASCIHSSPAIGSDGTIYIGSQDRNLYAFNPDGSLKWFFKVGGTMVVSSPAIGSDGTIYIGSKNKKLIAIGPPSPDITVEKTANVTVAKPGDLIEYTIYYNNNGPIESKTVWINDTLPDGVTFITSSAEGNRVDNYNWTFNNVPANLPTWKGPYMPSNRPPLLYQHDMTYDSNNNRVVLFGGHNEATGNRIDETWEYTTSSHTWNGPFTQNPKPSPREDHAMAYDSTNNKVILFGGWGGTGYGEDDTWEYDAATHTWYGPYIPSNRPFFLYGHDMTYDSENKRVVLFGGHSCIGESFDETWEYDATTHTWYGPYTPNPRPSPRQNHAMTYDSINNKVVLFGGWDGTGTRCDETWEYDTATHTWNGPYLPSKRPSQLYEHDMAYDSINNRVVLFGGHDDSIGYRIDETWEYETSTHTWYGPYFPNPRPSARDDHAMAYDSANNRVVLFGGWDGIGNDCDETWEYSWTHIKNSFTITVQVNLSVPNGSIVTNSVHLDYTDSLGNLMMDSTDTVDVLTIPNRNCRLGPNRKRRRHGQI
jgi:uncharacterized repeat protein (TIGR01451 family)